MNIKIRFVKPKDIHQLIDLCAEHARFEQAVYIKDKKATALAKQLFGHPPALNCLVVEYENELLGYASFMKQFSTWDADFYLYLDCLYLREKWRGQGLGYQLMQQISKFAKNENCSTIQWQTPDFNNKAISFYKKLAAIPKTKERFFWKV